MCYKKVLKALAKNSNDIPQRVSTDILYQVIGDNLF